MQPYKYEHIKKLNKPMGKGFFEVPVAENEPILSYAPGLRTKSLNSLAVRIGTIVEAEDQDES